MKVLSFALLLASGIATAWAGQAPEAYSAPDIPISHRDRVYAAEQFSNTVSVTDPADNTLLGVIRLGDMSPGNFSPLYRGQLLVHGMGFSPDHHTLAVVSIGSNSVAFIDTATNAIKHITYVGRSPHEAFFTPNGDEKDLRTRLNAPASNLTQDLYVSGELKTKRVMVKDEDVCLHCGLCAERCPTGAWDMQKFLIEMAQPGSTAAPYHKKAA